MLGRKFGGTNFLRIHGSDEYVDHSARSNLASYVSLEALDQQLQDPLLASLFSAKITQTFHTSILGKGFHHTES